MTDRILRFLTQIPEFRSAWARLPIGPIDLRTRHGAWPRPHYAYGVFAAAKQAKHLGLTEISAIEFGVAGGRGLLALEKSAQQIGKYFGLRISALGFDRGEGMPEPVDYRDLPHVWNTGFYKMDAAQLRKRLSPATQLILGEVHRTIPEAMAKMAPIGFISFDLDYYSSTKAAFAVFDSPASTRLPRAYCYFDDIMWPEWACHNEYVGELCAIREFNEQHSDLKLCPIHMLHRMRQHSEAWNEQMYVMHDFKHPLYDVNLMVRYHSSTEKPL